MGGDGADGLCPAVHARDMTALNAARGALLAILLLHGATLAGAAGGAIGAEAGLLLGLASTAGMAVAATACLALQARAFLRRRRTSRESGIVRPGGVPGER